MFNHLLNLEKVLNSLEGASIELNLKSDSVYFKQIKQSIIGINHNSILKPLIDI